MIVMIRTMTFIEQDDDGDNYSDDDGYDICLLSQQRVELEEREEKGSCGQHQSRHSQSGLNHCHSHRHCHCHCHRHRHKDVSVADELILGGLWVGPVLLEPEKHRPERRQPTSTR